MANDMNNMLDLGPKNNRTGNHSVRKNNCNWIIFDNS